MSEKARAKYKDKVRMLTRRSNPLSMYQVIQDLNEISRGLDCLFQGSGVQKAIQRPGCLDTEPAEVGAAKEVEAPPKKFQRMMIRSGFKPQMARRVWVKMNKWQSFNRTEVRFIMNLQWFRAQDMIFLDDFTQRTLEPPLEFSR